MNAKKYVLIFFIVLFSIGIGSYLYLNRTHGKQTLKAGKLSDAVDSSDAPTDEDSTAARVIRQLQKEIVFGEQDIVSLFSNGSLASIDIKTQETAEMLFACIRNCDAVTDLTDVNLEPMALPIEINGRGTGTFEEFYITDRETGRFLCFHFTPDDSERFEEYILTLR